MMNTALNILLADIARTARSMAEQQQELVTKIQKARHLARGQRPRDEGAPLVIVPTKPERGDAAVVRTPTSQ